MCNVAFMPSARVLKKRRFALAQLQLLCSIALVSRVCAYPRLGYDSHVGITINALPLVLFSVAVFDRRTVDARRVTFNDKAVVIRAGC